MKRASLLAATLMLTATPALADRVDEIEPYDTAHPLAMRLTFGDVGYGALSSGVDVDPFGMQLPSPADGSSPFLFACVDAVAGADTTLVYDFGAYGTEADDDDGPGGVPVLATPLMGGVYGVMDARVGEQGSDSAVSSYEYYSLVSYAQSTIAEVEPNDATASATALGNDAVTGTIGVAGDVDVFRFHATAGDRIIAFLANDTDNDDVTVDTLELLDAAGTVLANDGDGNVDQGTGGRREADAILFTATSSGTHYVRVSDPENTVGQYYSVGILVGGFSARPHAVIESQTIANETLGTATPFAEGFVARGNLSPAADVDAFRLSGVASGDSIFALVLAGICYPGTSATTRDPYLEVFDTNDNLIAQDNDSGSGTLPMVASVAAPSSGTIGFRVYENGVNATIPTYSLFAAAVNPAAATTENDSTNGVYTGADTIRSESVVGSLSSTSDVDFFAFRAMAGEQVIAIVDETPDGALNDTTTIVSFVNAAGTSIPTASNAAAVEVDLHTCPMNAPATGTLYARVAFFPPTTDIGPYRMVVLVDGEPAASKHGYCGDNIVQAAFEACDDGNTTADGNGCSATCTNVSVCGSSVREDAFEACDDGNVTAGDGCAADCAATEPGYSCIAPAGGLTTCTKIPETCDNGSDDDFDLLVDCMDSDCSGEAVCHDIAIPLDGGTGSGSGSGGCGCRAAPGDVRADGIVFGLVAFASWLLARGRNFASKRSRAAARRRT